MERLIIETEAFNAPKALCEFGEPDEDEGNYGYEIITIKNCGNCHSDLSRECIECPVQKCFDRLKMYEDAHEKIENKIKEIKSSANYPHNFMGQMADDFEWVLSLFN